MNPRFLSLILTATLLAFFAACAAPTPTVTLQPTMLPTALPTATPLPSPTATPSPAPTAPPPAPTFTPEPNRVIADKIPAPSLAKNLLGDAAEQPLIVYLPPSYHTSARRYPVVYYLPGYGDETMVGFNLPRDADALMGSGTVKEMILVIANGRNALDGSFYVNSPVTGNWEDWIVQDVVGYVDAHYRTVATAGARGITGHSMGGFGALNIATRHPEVFSAVYSMSPGLFDQNGLAESQMFASQSVVDAYLANERVLVGLPAAEAVRQMRRAGSDLIFTLAYGAAFSPDPKGPPPFIRYPYHIVGGKLTRDTVAWKAWESGFGGIPEEIQRYRANLLRLKGLVVDYGRQDEFPWIPKGCEYYAAQLTAQRIPHELLAHDGSHRGYVGAHIRESMLPFFSETLAVP